MINPKMIYPYVFGDIVIGESTTTFIATESWADLENSWEIKMYPTEPNSNNPLVLPSQALSSNSLLPTIWSDISVSI